MKFTNRAIGTILLFILASSHLISSYEIMRFHTHNKRHHSTRRVKSSHKRASHKSKAPGDVILAKVSANLKEKIEKEKAEMNKWLEFMDVKTCQEKEDSDAPDMDTSNFGNFDLGEFFMAVLESWELPVISDFVGAMLQMRNILDPKCPLSRPNFLSTYKYMLICNQDNVKLNADAEQAKIKSASQTFFTEEEKKQMENLNPHQTCLKAQEIINKHASHLQYGGEELYDKAIDRAEKAIRIGSTLEIIQSEKTNASFLIKGHNVAAVLEKHYLEVLENKDFLKNNNIDPAKDNTGIWVEVKNRLDNKYSDLITVKNNILNTLPNCNNIPNQALDKPMKLSFLRKLSIFLKTFTVWAHKCSILRLFYNVISEKGLDIIFDKAFEILEMFIGGAIVKIAKLVIMVIRVVSLLINAYKTWGEKKYKESSISMGNAVGTFLNGIFDLLGLTEKMTKSMGSGSGSTASASSCGKNRRFKLLKRIK
jgi:hypothetical protein